MRIRSDPAIFAYVSKFILNGFLPYRDIVDNKPPVIFYLGAFFMSIFKEASIAFWCLEALSVFLLCLIIFHWIKKIASPFSSFLFTSLFIIFSNVSLFYYFTAGFVEYPSALFVCFAYYIVLNKKNMQWHICSAISMALAVLTQQTSTILLLPIVFYYIYKRQWSCLLISFLTISFLMLLFCAWYIKLGIFGDFIYWTITYNKYYIQENPLALRPNRLVAIFYLFSTLPVIFHFSKAGIKKYKIVYILLLQWLCASVILTLLSGSRMYAHYYVNMACPLTLLLAFGYHSSQSHKISRISKSHLTIAILICVISTLPAMGRYGYFAIKRLIIHNDNYFLSQMGDVWDYLGHYNYPEENPSILLLDKFGKSAEFAMKTHTEMPKPIASKYGTLRINHPQKENITKHFIKSFLNKPPYFLVVKKGGGVRSQIPDQLLSFVNTRYKFFKNFNHYVLYKYSEIPK